MVASTPDEPTQRTSKPPQCCSNKAAGAPLRANKIMRHGRRGSGQLGAAGFLEVLPGAEQLAELLILAAAGALRHGDLDDPGAKLAQVLY